MFRPSTRSKIDNCYMRQNPQNSFPHITYWDGRGTCMQSADSSFSNSIHLSARLSMVPSSNGCIKTATRISIIFDY